MRIKHCWNDPDRGKPKYSQKHDPQCHFVHHKSHIHGRGIKPGPPLLALKIAPSEHRIKISGHPGTLKQAITYTTLAIAFCSDKCQFLRNLTNFLLSFPPPPNSNSWRRAWYSYIKYCFRSVFSQVTNSYCGVITSFIITEVKNFEVTY